MSGIIGTIGSRSAIIGVNELDYEEGTWTPNVTAASGSYNNFLVRSGTYTIIGKMIFTRCAIQLGATAVGGTGNPTGRIYYTLPVVPKQLASGGNDVDVIGYGSERQATGKLFQGAWERGNVRMRLSDYNNGDTDGSSYDYVLHATYEIN